MDDAIRGRSAQRCWETEMTGAESCVSRVSVVLAGQYSVPYGICSLVAVMGGTGVMLYEVSVYLQ